ncbi:SusC/RagA family TonB-linked outer membrane protein [Zunongwangia profunda]|uniref:TonB-dependent Receptor Plug domain protein n=2 Tax=Zunongwangia profunda TaxID=398743 RepID=D5BC59_ZUNPS|nr:TonB-dependent receptor [Zunongwangia profunda]ADF54685.1 tonB-dependent Receptor Plug domain protein [Zunongwangia profunda SM-A87]MAS70380.1 TonB-dependent receptor [Zunongwangia sp.]HCV81798.1 TonB-dependent receptor [Zunongwangia profunda]|tara:strand:+ start:2457 stop:5462 length:3006 start_codon:yes stop_codon:yes gene_type:complete
MKNKYAHVILIFFLLLFYKSFSQEIEIKGTVSDESGALPGASVIIKGTNNGTTTDFEGQFSLRVDPNLQNVLVVSFVGYRTKEVAISADQQNYEILLESDLNQLDDVVVVGYGTEKRANLTGAVSTIDEKAIEGKPVTNSYQALQGESSGLIIQNTTSKPGSIPQINIRGISTINGNTPLIVVDGVISSLNNINPSNIESISVLKDAASAAIYGSRAANGVILVTTKNGKKGKPRFTYQTMFGIQEPTNFPKFASSWEYATLRNEALINSGMAPAFTPEQILNFKENGPDVNWNREIYKDIALQNNHNLSMSGADNGLNYLVSLGYLDQESLFKGPDYGYQRYNARINLEKEINDKFKMGGRMSFARNDIKDHAYFEEWIIEPTVRMPPIYNIVDENGNYTLSSGSNSNPLAQLEQGGVTNTQNDEFLGNFSLEYKPIEDLVLKAVLGGNITSNKTHQFRKAIEFAYPGGGNNQNSVTDSYNRSLYLNPFITATYTKTFAEKHDFDLLLGGSSEKYKEEYFGVTGIDIPGNDFGVIDNAGDLQSANGSGNEWAIQSVFGKIGYTFDDKYLLKANLRYDGSSRFAEAKRWGVFPSVSAGWILSEENFFTPLEDVVSFAKIRASWGQLGNQDISDLYGYQSLVGTGRNVYSFGGVGVSGAYYSVSNQNRTWETSTMKNLGIDLSFFKRKLDVTFEVFDNLTEDILLQLPVPATYGLGQPFQNAGSVRNRGWELSMNYQFETGAVNHSFNFNISDNRNEIEDLRGREFINGFDVNTILREGYAINSYYALKADGFFNSEEEINNSATPIFSSNVKPGDIKYLDRNGDGEIDYENDRFILGNAFPRYTFGATYAMDWNGFDFSVFIQGVGKRQQWLRGEIVEAFHNNNEGPVFERHLDRWTPENLDASYPRLTVGAESVNNAAKSDFYIYDAQYLRIKNLQIGYTLPDAAVHNIGLESTRLYLTGLNLLTFSPLNDLGVDPESVGSSGRVYPVTRVFSLGLNINF